MVSECRFQRIYAFEILSQKIIIGDIMVKIVSRGLLVLYLVILIWLFYTS